MSYIFRILIATSFILYTLSSYSKSERGEKFIAGRVGSLRFFWIFGSLSVM
jgi:hypothetical protein